MPNEQSNGLLKDFTKWLHEDGKAVKTIESYVNDVEKFQQFLTTTEETGPLTRYGVVQYRQWMDNQLAISTINKKINSLKVFNDFLIEAKHLEHQVVFPRKDQVKVAHGSEKKVKVLDEHQVNQLLAYVENGKKVSKRNKAITYVLLYCGLRVSELCSLTVDDMDFLSRVVTVRGKGGKYREVGLRQDVIDVVKEYMKEERVQNPHHESKYLFLSQRSPKMHREAVGYWMRKVGEELGFHLHPHKLRHTLFTKLVKSGSGVDLSLIRDIAGHSLLQTTAQFYFHHSREEKQNALDSL
ncbi:tyrosine-type recombinase/integrase [Salimicrobium flavidum]|uniref:Integrase/recombinase XerD n=1 Tax=Salimicrobium flavidum TaxID=570947 RepID=A0A1N7IWL8_9BACI|nr:tyrosine-type recombinase/integrase [Salimicrobium flavidum]SIS41493.1 integrase/recombinase XerD [Salimicrobium flavidum]